MAAISVTALWDSIAAVPRGTVIVTGPQGPPGPPGASLAYALVNADSVTLPVGTPVAVVSGGGVVRAKASDATRPAIGVLAAAAVVGAACLVQLGGALQTPDWTAAFGAASLVPGQRYFVSATTAGKASTTVPTTGGTVIQGIGVALTTDTLDVSITPPYLNS